MAPYEALYGRHCRSPVCWNEVGERKLSKIELMDQTQRITRKIREKLRAGQDRQKSYADTRRRPLEFNVGDQVSIHNVFYISNLRQYMYDLDHVTQYEPLQLKENLTYRRTCEDAKTYESNIKE